MCVPLNGRTVVKNVKRHMVAHGFTPNTTNKVSATILFIYITSCIEIDIIYISHIFLLVSKVLQYGGGSFKCN